jgi:heme exporter protein A
VAAGGGDGEVVQAVMTNTSASLRICGMIPPVIVPAIDAKNLARRYGRRWALVDVSFQVPAGSVLMVAGRNGSGKSTLFRTLATAIRPDRGAASVLGFDLVRDRYDVRKVVALLSHQTYLYESLTARENLTIAARFLGTGGVEAALERVNLAARADDVVATFSAGMRKRLSFARVLMQEPKIALLDEPYGQLDPEGFALVDEVVRELKSRGTTVLMATHQVERGTGLADAALFLEAGRVAAAAPAAGQPGAAAPTHIGLPPC